MNQEYFLFKTSFAQERLWFLDQFAPGSPFYNIHVTLALPPRTSAVDVKRSVQEMVRRHEALRTTFVMKNGEPAQAVAPSLEIDLPVVDLRGRAAADITAAMDGLSRTESQHHFDLAKGPLFRVVFVELDEAGVLFLTMHHIVSDGWSMDVFTRELRILCDAFAAGLPSPLSELLIQYADYATWQRKWLDGEILARQLSYWKTRLAGAPALLELPTDRRRPPVQTYAGAYQSATISPRTTDLLRRIAQREGATMFMAVAAVFATLLHRYTQQDDVIIGTPIANRTRPEVQDLIGFFVNTLVLRTAFADNPTFRQLLRRVRQSAIEAYQHQDLPFEKLVAELAPARHLSHSPLFQAMFVHQTSIEGRPVAAGPRSASGLVTAPGTIEYGTSKFDLTLFTAEADDDGLAAIIEYSTDLFDDTRMTRLLDSLAVLMDGIVADPDRPVGELPLLSGPEKARLSAWAGSSTEYPRDSSIHELVAACAAQHPEAIAVDFEDERVTYRDLITRAERVAERLRRSGAGRGRPVAVLMDRSVELIVSLLGVLAAGAAYVPLDSSWPESRLSLMIEDTQAAILLTHKALLDRVPAGGSFETMLIDEPNVTGEVDRHTQPERGSADDLAYIMYTSGSTGSPKGVAVPHRAVVRLVRDTDYVSLDPREVLLHYAPVSFDASTFEIWGALCNGARLVVAPPRLLSIDELGALVAAHEVTTMWLTASLFHEVADGSLEPYSSVRQLLAGGDVLSPAHVARAQAALPHCRVINGYGPTEGTTFSCCHTVGPADEGATSLPIGRPIANTFVAVVDRRLQLVPIGVPGELLIGGDGLARGYWRADELTADRFIEGVNLVPGRRCYRTGDVVRWTDDGVLQFLGRRDHQVKIRGYRVELGEIEATLLRHPLVHAAIVIVRDQGGLKELAAHIAADPELDPDEARRFLRNHLPEYMIPSSVVLSSALPLTPTGKVDRTALAAAQDLPAPPPRRYVAPLSGVEQTVAGVWQQVLQRNEVGLEDNFFELGGHSLLMVRAQRRLQHALGTNLSLVELFQYSTVKALAAHIARTMAGDSGEVRGDAPSARQREAGRQRTARSAARRQEGP